MSSKHCPRGRAGVADLALAGAMTWAQTEEFDDFALPGQPSVEMGSMIDPAAASSSDMRV